MSTTNNNNNYSKENTEKGSKISEKIYKSIEITKVLINRTIICLALYGRASIEGIQEFIENIYGISVSVGKISGVIKEASKRAEEFDKKIDLSGIKQGANDEVFQVEEPVLTGIDLESRYVYLMEPEKDRTADTWEIDMMILAEQGLKLDLTVNDGSQAIMLGISNVFKGVDIQLDAFHASYLIGKQIKIIERKAYSLIEKENELEKRLKKKRTQKKAAEQINETRQKMEEAIERYDILQILYKWLVVLLGFSGYGEVEGRALIEYVLSEMEKNSGTDSKLQKHIRGLRENLEFALTFIKRLKEVMEEKSKESGIPIKAYEIMYDQLAYDWKSKEYQEKEYELVKLVMNDYNGARISFKELIGKTKRASSLVENLNSRIRTYMNVKRMVPAGFFKLMKVYFNTKKSKRSRIKGIIGKSPLEILTGKAQPNFLEAINF
jgi:hypothetical protein